MPDKSHTTGSPTGPALSRRAVIGGVAVLGAGVVVAGCASAAAVPADPGTAVGPISDVPVGGAKIFSEQGVVVTQPTAGTFAGFSTACPHSGCKVTSVKGDSIVCPCHGSTFAFDGSVTNGPAERGLDKRPVTVRGDRITLA